MTRIFNRYLMADAPAGGGAAVAEKPAESEASKESGTSPAAIQPKGEETAFKWADGSPKIFTKYKTPDEAAKAWTELQTKFNEQGKTLKELQDKAGETAEAQESRLINPQEWADQVYSYYQSGEIPVEAVAALSEKTGLPEGEIADYFEFKRHRREQFIERTKEVLGETTYESIEEWLNSGQSGYTDVALAGFTEMARIDDMSWLGGVKTKFEQAIEGGWRPNGRQQPRQKPGQAPPRKGRPVDAGAAHEGYRTRAEYQSELSAAKTANSINNDRSKLQQVEAKLKRTPQHVMDSKEWLKR